MTTYQFYLSDWAYDVTACHQAVTWEEHQHCQCWVLPSPLSLEHNDHLKIEENDGKETTKSFKFGFFSFLKAARNVLIGVDDATRKSSRCERSNELLVEGNGSHEARESNVSQPSGEIQKWKHLAESPHCETAICDTDSKDCCQGHQDTYKRTTKD